MKLLWKLSLTLTAAMCLLFGVHVFASARAQVERFQSDKENNGRLLGHSVAAAIASELELRSLAASKDLTVAIDARDPDVRVRWVDLSPSAEPSSRPAAEVRSADLDEADQLTLLAPGPDGEESVLTYTSLPDIAPRGSAVEISQSLNDKDAFLRATMLRAGATMLIMLIATAFIATLAGIFWVGRPVTLLLEKAKAIASGDFLSKVQLPQQDELGALGAALSEMGEELERKRHQVEREHEERLQAETQLRHAERLATVGKLASGVAHEVGTPLNVVSGHAGLIAENEAAPEECRKSAQVIRRQTTRISKIIRELLDFARRRHGQSNMDERIDLVALSRRTVALVKTLEVARGAKISVSGETESMETVGDASQIQQVLMNLCVNGLQALDGEGNLSIELATTRTQAPNSPNREEGEYLCLSVVDDGTGITEDDLPHLFEPFFTTKDVGEGTGLGLSVVYGIVQDYGGWIDVQSSPGEGSRFNVYLPRGDTTEPQQKEPLG